MLKQVMINNRGSSMRNISNNEKLSKASQVKNYAISSIFILGVLIENQQYLDHLAFFKSYYNYIQVKIVRRIQLFGFLGIKTSLTN